MVNRSLYRNHLTSRGAARLALAAALAMAGGSGVACQAERVPLDTRVVAPTTMPVPPLSAIHAGPLLEHAPVTNPFAGNAYALQQGQRYYRWFNCDGCHGAIGGGSMGPPLKDLDWIYGGDPAQIFDSILRGRPNGMPAFGGAVSHDVAWQLVGFVQSLGGSSQGSSTGARSREQEASNAGG